MTGAPVWAKKDAVDPTPLTVLIVDDCQDTASSLAMLVSVWGHRAFIAHDGPAALAMADHLKFDVVMLDIALPGMNGWEVARVLRRDLLPPGALLIALSGYGQDKDLDRSRQAGCDHHLIKPAIPDALRLLLESRSRQLREGAPSTAPTLPGETSAEVCHGS
jgi:CheY-like chemotaxis protein